MDRRVLKSGRQRPGSILDQQLHAKDYERYEGSFERYIQELPGRIRAGLRDQDPTRRYISSAMIQYIPEAEQLAFRGEVLQNIRTALSSPCGVELDYARLITSVPGDEQMALRHLLPAVIRRGVRRLGVLSYAYAELIPLAPEAEQPVLREELYALIRERLYDRAPVLRRFAAQLISCVPEDRQEELRQLLPAAIRQGLNNRELLIAADSAEMIRYTSEHERAPLVGECMKYGSSIVRRIGVTMVEFLPEEERTPVIQRGLEDQDWVRAEAMSMIRYAPESDQHLWRAMSSIPTVDVSALAVSTPLYDEAHERFFRKSFVKTGSELMLLDTISASHHDASLKHAVVMRTAQPTTVFLWRRAFESSDVWRQCGFDHVPVEPIVGIRPSKRGIEELHVFTRVIPGPSAKNWQEATSMWNAEINTQKKQIIDGLDQLGIRHGHLHDGNFVLYFERDTVGSARLSRPPLVYVIDFDQASDSAC